MSEYVVLRIDGKVAKVPAGTSVAAAVLAQETTRFRTSVTREPRGPLCGMGICFECRVTIDGRRHRRSCLIPVKSGMVVETT